MRHSASLSIKSTTHMETSNILWQICQWKICQNFSCMLLALGSKFWTVPFCIDVDYMRKPHGWVITSVLFYGMWLLTHAPTWSYGRWIITYHSFTVTETKMSSFWWKFHHWLHRKLSFWQLSVQPVMKISSKWRHFRFSGYLSMRQTQGWFS